MKQRYNDVNWQRELDEYFARDDTTISHFTKGKPYSYDAFKLRLYRDPRYQGKNKTGTMSQISPVFIPVVAGKQEVSSTVTVNEFRIEINDSVKDSSLKRLLSIMREL